MIELTLNEHKLLTRLANEGLLPYEAIDGLALDRLISFGFARVLDVLSARAAGSEIRFIWGRLGDETLQMIDPAELVPRRAVNITDKGRKELHLRD